jgi:hypothetical protein
MNTTEIITKLRAQAAELTALADALEEATENAAFATGAGRYLIHGAVGRLLRKMRAWSYVGWGWSASRLAPRFVGMRR